MSAMTVVLQPQLDPVTPLRVPSRRVLRSSAMSAELEGVPEHDPPPYQASERKVRPLPAPPSPTTPPTPTSSRSRSSLRPLPSPPSSSPPSPNPGPSQVSISIAPPTPLPRDSNHSLDVPKPSPEHSIRQLPLITTALSLKTDEPWVINSARSSLVSLASPSTPLIPEAPTPTTARRRRMSKLRRHLGEAVPCDLVSADDSDITTTLIKSRMVAKLYEMRDDSLFSNKAVQLQTVQTKDDVWTEFDDSDEAESEEEADVVRVVHLTKPFQPSGPKRYSKRWVKERGSRRWVEEDYEDVLRTLRSL